MSIEVNGVKFAKLYKIEFLNSTSTKAARVAITFPDGQQIVKPYKYMFNTVIEQGIEMLKDAGVSPSNYDELDNFIYFVTEEI